MLTPSRLVTNCGKQFSFVSNLRQSYSAPQYRTRAWILASGVPWDPSSTVSLSGQRVAAIRRRNSSISGCGISTRNGRRAVAPAGFSLIADMHVSLLGPAPSAIASHHAAPLPPSLLPRLRDCQRSRDTKPTSTHRTRPGVEPRPQSETRGRACPPPQSTTTRNGFPFSTRYAASSAARPLPIFRTAWTVSGGTTSASPAP